MTNRLAREKSPYLLQHGRNPVDWYPWGREAFEKARAEHKPIFLSVGYSTCHWCHVMAHESFEDERIAAALNRDFVPVKVDREERPDVDRVYMLFVQASTGSGGWPMSVWLTPELEPFYGGTYFPPTSRWGRPGFLDVLVELARIWRDEPSRIRQSATALASQMQQLASRAGEEAPGEPMVPAPDVLVRAVADFEQSFDGRHGGFGDAPKFPRPAELLFLMREWARTGSANARDMALNTLRAMMAGGIHDHLGGGFHRYSVDARWHVPHFEKMLYDQAQLALAYLEAFQLTGDARFADVARSILRYVQRDLARDGGGFFSAEDADSLAPEHAHDPNAHATEGAFYVWDDAEFGAVAGPHADVARLRYGVRSGGNVETDPHGEFAGRNILYLARALPDLAKASATPTEEVARRVDEATNALFEARRRRPRPGLDDKVIVAWNGLMIAAFARASRALRAEKETAFRFLRAAREAARFIRAEMWNAERRTLMRRYRDGEAAVTAYAEDYASLIFGLLELFQADGDVEWLRWAIALQDVEDKRFWDDERGGWFSTDGLDPSVLVRLKEEYDGAEPSASSLSVLNLLALGRLAARSEWLSRAERALAAFAPQLSATPRAMPMLLAALSTWHAPKQEVVIVGVEGRDDTECLLDALGTRYLPFAVVIPAVGSAQAAIADLLSVVTSMPMRNNRATAYVCRDFACEQPAISAAAMLAKIGYDV